MPKPYKIGVPIYIYVHINIYTHTCMYCINIIRWIMNGPSHYQYPSCQWKKLKECQDTHLLLPFLIEQPIGFRFRLGSPNSNRNCLLHRRWIVNPSAPICWCNSVLYYFSGESLKFQTFLDFHFMSFLLRFPIQHFSDELGW